MAYCAVCLPVDFYHYLSLLLPHSRFINTRSFLSFLQKYFIIIISIDTRIAPPQLPLSRQQPMSLLCALNAWPMADGLADWWCIKCIYRNPRNLKLFHTLETLNEL